MRIYPLIFNSMLIFKIQVVFLPLIFFAMLKRAGITDLKRISAVLWYM